MRRNRSMRWPMVWAILASTPGLVSLSVALKEFVGEPNTKETRRKIARHMRRAIR